MEELSGQIQDGQEAMGTLWGPALAHSQVSSRAGHGTGLPPGALQGPAPSSHKPSCLEDPSACSAHPSGISSGPAHRGRPFLLTAAVSLILSAICNCPFVYCLSDYAFLSSFLKQFGFVACEILVP